MPHCRFSRRLASAPNQRRGHCSGLLPIAALPSIFTRAVSGFLGAPDPESRPPHANVRCVLLTSGNMEIGSRGSSSEVRLPISGSLPAEPESRAIDLLSSSP